MEHQHNSGKSIIIVIIILSIVFILELFGGLIFSSLSLISDSAHVFFDVFSLVLTYAALSIAKEKNPTKEMTYGYHRLEVFSAIINGVTLTGVSFIILYEAYHRLFETPEINAFYVMVIAIVGLIINIISALIIMSDKSYKIDINIKSAFLHLVGDSGASLAVVIGMIFIIYTGIRIIDPIVAILISILILFSATKVLLKTIKILLQKSPINIEKIIEEIKEIMHVNGVEDVHFWQVCSYFIVGTANVITDLEKIEDTENIRREIAEILKVKYNVQHITLQFETPEMSKLHKHQLDHKH